jgi:hypothetical protein
MKGNILIKFVLPIVAVLILLIFVGTVIMPGAISGVQETTINGCTLRESGGLALVPYFGYYRCEPYPSTEVITTNYIGNDPGGIGFFGNSPEVEFRIHNLGTGSWQGWRICNVNGCTSWDSIWVGGNKVETVGGGEQDATLGPWMEADPAFFGDLELQELHLDYSLYQYERNSANRFKDSACSLPSKDYCTGLGCIASFFDEGKNNPTIPNTGKTSGTLGFDQISRAYLVDWLVSPVESAVKNYQGQDVFCHQSVLYDVGFSELQSGCYAHPGSNVITSVDCCHDAQCASGEVCIDFECETGEVGCCQGGICSVIYCDGQGNPFCIDKVIKKATTCTNQGECIYSTVNVECCDASDCSSGQSCVNNECVGGVEPCGDSDKDCFDDCTNEYIIGCVPETCQSVGQNCDFFRKCCSGLRCSDGFCEVGTAVNWFKNFLVSLAFTLFIFSSAIVLSFIPFIPFKIFVPFRKFMLSNWKLSILVTLLTIAFFMVIGWGVVELIGANILALAGVIV